MIRDQAITILTEMTKGESLLRHARSVEIVMRAYADKLKEDPEEWGAAGLLHDADYESYPEQHPDVIVKKLREMGEDTIAHAISAHYTKWEVPYTNQLDKALLAVDELTGFIIACCQVRPEGIASLTSKSVIKKLKQKSFAARVERDEVNAGVELLNVELKDHIDFIIAALKPYREELSID